MSDTVREREESIWIWAELQTQRFLCCFLWVQSVLARDVPNIERVPTRQWSRIGSPPAIPCTAACDSPPCSALCPQTELPTPNSNKASHAVLNRQKVRKSCILSTSVYKASADLALPCEQVGFLQPIQEQSCGQIHCLSVRLARLRKNIPDQKRQVHCLLILTQITYKFAWLETKLIWFQNQQKCVNILRKMVVGFCSGIISLTKKGCIVIGCKQKCLQMVEVHMQCWFGQNKFIPPIKQLQNPLLFHPSLLMKSAKSNLVTIK